MRQQVNKCVEIILYAVLSILCQQQVIHSLVVHAQTKT
jgi:hypothetical protein